MSALRCKTSFADDSTRPDRPEKPHVQVQGGLKLVGVQGREKRRAHRVVQHGGQKSPQHVAHRIGERFRRLERDLNRAAFHVGLDELETKRGCGPRYRGTSLDTIPEWPGPFRGRLHLLIASGQVPFRSSPVGAYAPGV